MVNPLVSLVVTVFHFALVGLDVIAFFAIVRILCVRYPIVSSDIVGTSASCIIDSLLTMVQGGNMAKVVGWYDNEWGYSNRVVDLIGRLAS